ncbi:MAG: S8 family serine peptidase [Actinobacteria bacterium]|nr:S8 family serine peptidase [Actinomycetota bacterium]
MKTYLILLLIGLLVLGFTGVSFGQDELFEEDEIRTIKGPKWAPEEIIVKFKRGISEDVIRQINQRHGTSVLSISKRGQFMRLRIPSNRTVEEMVSIYSRNPNVEYAEPNFIASALITPNDPYYSYQWHLDNSIYGGIHMESAWDIQTGNPDVVVAVVDTGVAYESFKNFQQAPDLANTSFVAGYDFVNNDTHPNDDEGHGTHVAGTVAQSTNNNLGVAGVAFNVSIMPLKVLDATGSGTYANVADGIYFAADNGAAVINLSLGGTSQSTTLEKAVAYAYSKGVTIVCAAGNEYLWGNSPLYPAAYDAYCIAVGATRFDETRAYYSNTGTYLDITAPGGDLNVDQNNDGYGDGVLQQTFGNNPKDFGYWFYQGTSMAAPHVSGVSALLIANGTTGPTNVKKALEDTAEDKGPEGWDEDYGWGIVDAYAALSYSTVPVHDVAVTGISALSWCVQGDSIDVVVNVANQGDYEEAFDVTLTDTTDSVEIGSQLVSLPAKGTADLTFTWDTTTSSLADHILLAEAGIVSGETDTADNTMTTTVTVKEPIHDVAVIDIDAPLEAYQGDLVSVSITVENQGTYSETTTVSLTDTTDGVLIGSKIVSLNAGDLTIVPFDWGTTGVSIGDHTLKAETSVVEGETDTADNSMTTKVTIKEKLATTMHIANIDMVLSTRIAGPNKFIRALATVTIVDANNDPVEGATVYGSWSGATSDTDSGITDTTGKVVLESDQVKNPHSGITFTFTVENVTKSGCTYDSAINTETSDSIIVP